MKILIGFALFFFLGIVAVVSLAADWKAIKGTYAVTPRNYLDPSDEEQKDSRFRFQLSGDAAKDLYRAMKVGEKQDECTGAISKSVGEMQCLYYKKGRQIRLPFLDRRHEAENRVRPRMLSRPMPSAERGSHRAFGSLLHSGVCAYGCS